MAASVEADLEAVAFGTVASVAARASTSGPTVVRAATKLGFDGFAGLQAAVQEELAARLRPAAELIRRRPRDALTTALATEVDNVRATLEAVDRRTFDRAVGLLADERRRVRLVSGDGSGGVALILADALSVLRRDVDLVAGSPVGVSRRLADLKRRDVLVAIDVRRYDAWLLEAVRAVRRNGARIIAVTDSLLSPLAARGGLTFVVDAQGVGPFDSHVGTLALANALVSSVAVRLGRSAVARADLVEAAWREAGALIES